MLPSKMHPTNISISIRIRHLEYTQEDWTNTTLWKDFYAEYMQKHLDDDTVIERYEKQYNTLEQLRDALVKDREKFSQ